MEKRVFLDKASLQAAIKRLAEQVCRSGLDQLVLVGIKRRGVPIAQRMHAAIKAATGREVLIGDLDITLYRDDLTEVGSAPQVKGGQLNFPLEGKRVVLIDDVLYTGRTVRAALDAVISHGRPAKIELAVLVDRGHRELPIEANYAPHRIATSDDEVVKVQLEEVDGVDRVEIATLPKS